MGRLETYPIDNGQTTIRGDSKSALLRQTVTQFRMVCWACVLLLSVAAHVSPPNDCSDFEVDMLIHQPASEV